jgi:hypothetical protein
MWLMCLALDFFKLANVKVIFLYLILLIYIHKSDGFILILEGKGNETALNKT